MMRFCFVVLHYKTAEDTIECIKSIHNLEDESFIVVVDNASNNGSIEKVEEFFQGYNNIHVIKNERNLGFAEGNNVGFDYAKNKINSEFIAVLNNDIIIRDEKFIKKIEQLYDNTKFDLAGPDIESLADHGHQNPILNTVMSIKDVDKEILRYSILKIINRTGLYDKIKRGKSVRKNKPTEKTQKQMINVTLHGAFVIFSKNYIDNEKYCFRAGTFLYMEEAILYRYCMLRNYKTVYNPSVTVYHKEDSSTSSLFLASRDKRDFIFSNMIKSLRVYKKILMNEGEATNEERL